MEEIFSNYQKKKEYLICVDSDGCAMDTMGFKHMRCFGPCMVKQWELESWQDEILDRWNQINLYARTRGVNRFQGLSLALQEINEKYCEIAELNDLVNWVKDTRELSNQALKEAIGRKPESISLKKALAWSQDVNEQITNLPEEEKKPFPYVKEALAFAHKYADVVVVSSANRDAIFEEWERCGLLAYTDLVLAQDCGSKAFCMKQLIDYGYDCTNVLMCGDAIGDFKAAEKNGIYFFPILAQKESESWKNLMEEGISRLLEGTYGGEYQGKKYQEFLNNFK